MSPRTGSGSALGARAATHLAGLYGLEPARAMDGAQALMMALQGAAQFDITARRDPATLPEALRDMFAAHAFEASFPPAARLILSALR